ncbi:hypothetical protein [Sphaerisporangium fuscum]|uniref:hypothetical protein n=1 Tax=Sphaerisporangium fuscum TaxID=2835868 RepID=UPI001BDD0289|nr:hypothetical protein [Sphaerisporangium fuscum]
MNSTFEDRLLAELKTEMAARRSEARTAVPARRWTTGRRFFAAAGVLGVAAAAAIAVPLVTGSSAPAYAVTKNPDGTINLRINEFRDPEGAEKELAAAGVKADITYMPLGKRCEEGRFHRLPEDEVSVSKEELESRDPQVRAEVRRKMLDTPSGKAIQMRNGITIHPEYIKPGQTVVLEIAENSKEPTAEHPGVAYQVISGLTDGPVQPCKLIDQPDAFDIGDATPPPGAH